MKFGCHGHHFGFTSYLLRLHTRATFVLPMLPADPKLFYFCAMFIYKKGTEKCVSLFRFIDY